MLKLNTFVLILSLTACSGTKTQILTAEQEDKNLQLEGFDALTVEGRFYQPSALGAPTLVKRKITNGKRTTAQQEKKYKGAKGSKKEIELQVLVSMIWRDGQASKPEATNARIDSLISDYWKSVGDNGIGAITLRQLATVQLLQGKDQEAVKTLELLQKRDPSEKSAEVARVWLSYLSLRAGDVAKAKTILGSYSEKALDAYVAAWIAHLEGRKSEVGPLITKAFKTWPMKQDVIINEMHYLTSQNTSAKETVALYNKTLDGLGTEEQVKRARFVWLFNYSAKAAAAGHFDNAIESLDSAVADGTGSPNEIARVRFEQGHYALSNNNPRLTATKYNELLAALNDCGEACEAERAQFQPRVLKIGHHFRSIYESTFDEDYYEPAQKLYAGYAQLPVEDAKVAQENSKILTQTREQADPDEGTHNKERIAERIKLRKPVVQGCYEHALLKSKDLTGDFSLKLAVAADGTVTEAKVDGLSDQNFVDCMTMKAKTWTFPSRTVQGVTNIDYKMSLTLAE